MLDKVRNIGIMAHVDAGKTTTTERILYYSGTKHKVGDVDSGDTTTDFDPLEKQKGITINSAAVSVDWGENIININDKLLAVPAVVTLPAGQDSAFEGLLDLVRMKFITRDETDPTRRKFFINDIPDKYRDEAVKRREELLDTISAASDELTELLLEGKPVSEELIRKTLRKGTLEGVFTPIHCGSAKMYQGVQQLLDLVVDCLPSPLDRPPVEGLHPKTKDVVVRKPDPKEPLAALALGKSLDSGKVGESLSRLTRDDPTLKQHTDEETKETILSGMGELHLEVSLEKLRRALNIPQGDPQVALGKPRVAYRQTF